MRPLAISILVYLAVISAIAHWWRPAPDVKGRTQLVWTTGNNPIFPDLVKEFERSNPTLQVTIDAPSWTKDKEKIIIQASSSVGADIIDSVGEGELQRLVETGVAWDITDQAGSANLTVDRVIPAARSSAVYQGRQYGYPAGVVVDVLFFNKTIFDRHQLAYPHDEMEWGEFLALSSKLVSVMAKEGGFALTGLTWEHLFYSARGQYFNEDGTRLTLRTAALREALEIHRDLIHRYRAQLSTTDIGALAGQGGYGNGAINLFANGRFAMMVRNSYANFAFVQRKQYEQSLAVRGEKVDPLEIGCVRLPRFSGQAPAYYARARTAIINAKSPHREAALRWLSFLDTPFHAKEMVKSLNSVPANPDLIWNDFEESGLSKTEQEIYRTSVEALTDEHSPRLSPFLLFKDVQTEIELQVARLESNRNLSVDDAIAAAEFALQAKMERNLRRSPSLRALYLKMTGRETVEVAI